MLIQTIRERQKNWVRHLLRSDSLLRTIWEGRKENSRKAKNEVTWLIEKTENRTYEDPKKIGVGEKKMADLAQRIDVAAHF